MKKRVISGIIMALIVIPIIIIGGPLYDLFIGLLAVMSVTELINNNKPKMPFIMRMISNASVLLLVFSNVSVNGTLIFGLKYSLIAIIFLLMLIPTIFLYKKNYTSEDALYLLVITLFIGISFSLFISVFNESILYLLFIVLVATITDIFALFGGKLVGSHKLTKISPNKTIEGSICGTLFATIIGATFYYTLIGGMPFIEVIIMVIVLSIVGQFGDLFFSLIKRENDIKDYSNLIPGHGGILDRLDSLIFVVLAYVIMITYL